MVHAVVGWRHVVVVSVVWRINKVTVRWAWLVLGWVTVFGAGIPSRYVTVHIGVTVFANCYIRVTWLHLLTVGGQEHVIISHCCLLQPVQNTTARPITGTRRSNHILPVLSNSISYPCKSVSSSKWHAWITSRCLGRRLSTWPMTAIWCPTALGALCSQLKFWLAANTQQLWRQNFCSRVTSPVELSSSPAA